MWYPRPRWSLVAIPAFLIAMGFPAHALEYVEASAGLVPPTLDGGRTEVEMADVNGDGHLDLVSIGDHGSPFVNTDQHGIMVWFGDGRGSWSLHQTGNFGYGGIAVGDLDGDGAMDVAYGMHHNYSGVDLGDQILEAALGDGTGTSWTAWDDGLATNGETWGMFGTDLADVDNDGDLDIGSVSFGCCAGVHVYLNQGDGTWVQSFGLLGGNTTMEFVFGDVDADGNADFAVGHQMGTVYRGDGSGGFTLADGNLPPAGSVGRRGPALGDIDGDGDQDLAFTTTAGGVQVWRWESPGEWTASSDGLPASGGYDATQIHDLDGDGIADVTAFGDGLVMVWLGDGNGQWTETASFTVGDPGRYQAFRTGGDVDHNGRPDIVLVEEEGSWPTYRNHLRLFTETTWPTALEGRVVSPGSRQVWVAGSTRSIEWAAAVLPLTEARVRLDLSRQGPDGPWEAIGEDLPNGGRHQWRVTPGPDSPDCHLRLRLTAASDTAWAISPAFTITSGSPVSVPAPTVARPLHLWPNPTSGGVWLTLPHPGEGSVVLEIFDAGGRRVGHHRWPGGGFGAGSIRSLFWDARVAPGRPLPAGVYHLQLRTATDRRASRLLVVR